MASTIKYTLFNLILVVIIEQYISIQFPSKYKRSRRAILQEETNHTAHTSFAHAQRLTHTLETLSIDPSLSTIAFNTTLTSEERLQQLQKLKDAEMHLRKNLREKGKEYENQLYENWPNLLARLEKEGPFAFLSESNKYIWDRLTQGGITFDQLVANWSSFMQMFRERGTRTFLRMVDKYKKDEDAVTLPTRRTSDVGQSNVPNLF